MEQTLTETNPAETKKYKPPEYLKEMNIIEKLENHKIIMNMNKRINYLKNPRYRVIRRPITFQDAFKKAEISVPASDPTCLFRPTPNQIIFQDYMIDQVYEIKLTLTNIDKLSRRFKYLPPGTNEFTVTDVKYPIKPPQNIYEDLPGREFGMIAPGMSVVLSVKFHATSFAEFEDTITVFCDESVLKIPLIARKEPPSINLPEILDCKSCWLGDRSEVVFKITNKGGEAGFKFFSENEQENENDPENLEVLKVRNFQIYPAEFFIQKNETIEIFVQYVPTKEGIQTENIILACDNQTSAKYKL